MGRGRRVPARRAGLIALPLLAVATVGIGGERVLQALVPFAIGDECEARRPLVVDLHGYSETVVGHENTTGWHAFAAENGFDVITPQASGRPSTWELWDDVATVERAIDTAVETSCADPDRVYVTGYSMGGFLASHVACQLAERVAAVAPVAGARLVRPCAQSRPVPVLFIHGTDDDTVLFDGGLNPVAAGALGLPEAGASIPAVVQLWADRNQCGDDSEVVPDGAVTVYRYGCATNADVELHVIAGGTHAFPKWVKERIWAFFERHTRTPEPPA